MGAAVLQLRSQIEARFDLPSGFRKAEKTERFSTGITAIDQLTDGGIPRGTLSEVCGAESSGRTALLFAILRQSTKRGECCAWIDATGAFDPASARDMEIDLSRLLWVDCGGNCEHALKCTDLLIQAGGFGLVVMDLAGLTEREVRRIPLASWFRLRHAAERSQAALIAVSRQITAQSCSALQIEMKRRSPVWRGKLLRGLAGFAESRKHMRAHTAEFQAVR